MQIDPYKFGKQVVKRTFQQLDEKAANSVHKTFPYYAAGAKRGLVALVKENPKDFYTAVGKSRLRDIDNINDPLPSILGSRTLANKLINWAYIPHVASDMEKFKALIKDGLKLTD